MFNQYLRYLIIPMRKYTTRKNIRVRFAPSPTGYLHLGGLRTALYNFLFAKKHGGKFILRIEDTDQTRVIVDATKQLQKDLIWGGIEIDEGPDFGGIYGPYIQSERMDFYRKHIKTLLDNNTAYYCFCTNKRLELLRKEAVRTRQVPKYDNRCRHLSNDDVLKKLRSGDKYCIRFRLSTDITEFNDLIYGNITYDITQTEGDPVIIKSDGFPTYHFANVVDDHLMEISHVLRGVEWQISTTKHLMMYRAFGWDSPAYGHLPLLMNADGTKLSKRQGDIQISHYRDSGIFPQALINYITSSGGGFEKDSLRNVKPICYTVKELVNQFDIAKINVSSGKLKPEKLDEFNRLEIQRLLQDKGDEMVLVEKIQELIRQNVHKDTSIILNDINYIRNILKWGATRIHRLADLFTKDFMFLWVMPSTNDDLKSEEVEILSKANQILSEWKSDDWSKDSINELLRNTARENDFVYNKLMKLLRSALSGLKEGPSVGEMMSILGKENSLKRLKICLERRDKQV